MLRQDLALQTVFPDESVGVRNLSLWFGVVDPPRLDGGKQSQNVAKNALNQKAVHRARSVSHLVFQREGQRGMTEQCPVLRQVRRHHLIQVVE